MTSPLIVGQLYYSHNESINTWQDENSTNSKGQQWWVELLRSYSWLASKLSNINFHKIVQNIPRVHIRIITINKIFYKNSKDVGMAQKVQN